VSQQVIHADFVSLDPETGPEDRRRVIEAASRLKSLPQVVAAGVIEAGAGDPFDMVFYFVLHGFSELEPFGTDARYVRFLQGELAPRLKAFAGADVRLDEDLAGSGEEAACLALIAPDETYDWEVRQALQDWLQENGAEAGAVGVAVGERQAYRGLALAFGGSLRQAPLPDETRYRATLLRGRARPL
jgi:hypothetical protein